MEKKGWDLPFDKGLKGVGKRYGGRSINGEGSKGFKRVARRQQGEKQGNFLKEFWKTTEGGARGKRRWRRKR